MKTYDSYRSAYRIEDGIAKEPLPDFIRRWIYNDTLSEYKYAGPIEPSTGVILTPIIRSSIDTCQADFKISLGALLTTVISKNSRIT